MPRVSPLVPIIAVALLGLSLSAGCRRPQQSEPDTAACGDAGSGDVNCALRGAAADAGTAERGGDAGESEVEPPDADCVDEHGVERAPTEAESRATFDDLALNSYFACASCHSTGTPSGSGGAWGTPDAAWHDASVELMEREPSATPNEDSALFLHFTALGGLHPGIPGATDAVLSWLAFRDSTIIDVPEGACDGENDEDGEADAGPGVEPPVIVCTQQPVAEGVSRAKWNELDMGANFSCAGCHANLGTPDGRGADWGPGDDDWWTASTALIDDQAVLPADATSLYLHFTPNFTRFHEDGTVGERESTLEWILFHRSGSLPPGCD